MGKILYKIIPNWDILLKDNRPCLPLVDRLCIHIGSTQRSAGHRVRRKLNFTSFSFSFFFPWKYGNIRKYDSMTGFYRLERRAAQTICFKDNLKYALKICMTKVDSNKLQIHVIIITNCWWHFLFQDGIINKEHVIRF